MPTFVLLWDPTAWEWPAEERAAATRRISMAGASAERWSTGTRHSGIEPGDRIFLSKVKRRPLGIIAAGSATTSIFTDKHWDETRDTDTPFVEVAWDSLVSLDDVLLRETLIEKIPEEQWTFYGGGVRLDERTAALLEAEWTRHLIGLGDAKVGIEQTPAMEFDDLTAVFSNGPPRAGSRDLWKPGKSGGTSPESVERLLSAPQGPAAVAMLNRYLEHAHLVSGTWGVSCLPTYSNQGHRRAFTVNIGGTEAFFVWMNPAGYIVGWGVLIDEAAASRCETIGLEVSQTQHGWFAHHFDRYAFVAALEDDAICAAVADVVAGADYVNRTRRKAWHNERLLQFVSLDNDYQGQGTNSIRSSYQYVVAKQRRHQDRFRRLLFGHYPPVCAACGFDAVEILEAAHIVPDAAGCESSIANGRLLCPNHHRAHDAGFFHFEENDVIWREGSTPFGRPGQP